MQIKHCGLKITVLKNQTRIAKHASYAQQLLLTLEYLQLAPSCITKLSEQGHEELANRLQATRTLFEEQLTARIFNATLAANQFRSIWRAADTPSRYSPAPHLTLLALRKINLTVTAWLSGNYAANNLEFELLLSRIATARLLCENTYSSHFKEIIRLERLLQAAVPPAYRKWKLQRNLENC